jgi:exoribonuclease-2
MIEDHKWKVFCLSLTGEVFVHLRQDVQFAIPGLVSSDLAARCGIEHITDDPKRVNARVEVLKKLKQLNLDVETSYKGHDRNLNDWNRQRHVNVYSETRSADPTRWAKTTVEHVAHLMWQQPKYFHYYAVHKYLMEQPLRFVATDNCLTSQTFHVRPLRDVEEVETVEKWIADHRRQEDGQLSRFIRKARIVIQRYWDTQRQNDSGPLSQRPAKHTWDEEDQFFIRFLLRSLAPWRSVQKDPYDITKINLLKLLYPEIYNVTDVATFQCLKELGVVAPWHDPFESIHHANPSGDFYTPDAYNRESEEIAKRTVQSKAVAGSALGPEDLHSVDPLDSVRHDFGGMRVFVIDEAGAEELDDGISVERIPSEPDKYWVHTHIADPASLLHPGHVLSLRARERGSTLYFRQKTFPLFPKSLIHDPLHGLSLGTRSSAGSVDRTLTFSAKLDMEGNILDHKIRAGVVRNIRKVTYAACDKLLGLKPIVKLYPFGQSRFEESPEPRVKCTEDELGDLKLLLQLLQQQVKRRFAENIFMLDSERASVDITTPPDSATIQSPSMSGSIFCGFPEMEYSVTSSEKSDQGSRMIVSEMMKLASRVASRVALEHGLPLIRRAQDPMVPVSEKTTKAMLRARSPNGYIPMHKFMNHVAMTPASVYTLEPKRHCGVGIPEGEGYSRATSPLRRFEDLVVHWQLHHLLLGPNAPPKYPFSQSEMERLCIDMATVDRTNRKLHAADEFFHSLLFMKRWMEETEKGVTRRQRDPLAGALKAYKLSSVRKTLVSNAHVCGVAVPELGILAHLVDLKAEFHDVPVSSPVPVKVKRIDLAVNRSGMHFVLAE